MEKSFSRFQEARDYALDLSCYFMVRMEVRRLVDDSHESELLAVCENGQYLQKMQMDLFGDPSAEEIQIIRDQGKIWWKTLGRINQVIERSRLLDLTEKEKDIFREQETFKNSVLEMLEREMLEVEFAAAKWKYIDSIKYKNRKAPMPKSIQHFDGSTVRKYYLRAIYKTGEVSIRENWPVFVEESLDSVNIFFTELRRKTIQHV